MQRSPRRPQWVSFCLANLCLLAIILASCAAHGDFSASASSDFALDHAALKRQQEPLPCEEQRSNLTYAWGKTLFCVNKTESFFKNGDSEAVLSTTQRRLVCTNCDKYFADALERYGTFQQECDLAENRQNLDMFFYTLKNLTQFYPCFIPSNCEASGSGGYCGVNTRWLDAKLPAPGKRSGSTCSVAIKTSCEVNPSQPYCYCTNGHCQLRITKGIKTTYRNISMFEMTCDPTGSAAVDIDGGAKVEIRREIDDTHYEWISLSDTWKNPPLIWQENNCTDPKKVTLFGDMRRCSKGFSCPMADGHIQRMSFCEPGYYCPDPSGPAIKCPAGYYCPAGMWKPIKCQMLSVCPEGALVDTPFIGVIIAIIFLVLVLVAYRVAKSREEVAWARMAEEDEKRHEKVFTKVRNDNDEENEHVEVEVDASTVMKEVEARLNIKFKDLSVTIPPADSKSEPKTIMSGVNGKFSSGKVTAVMGPSGSGKTTLISCLLGQINRSGGEVRINGEIDELSEYRKIIGFVPQDDIMINILTVKEVLMHSALTRLSNKWSHKDVESQVDAVIHLLDLTKVRNSIIGDEVVRGISGGQKKRVNIGMELVMNPAMLILDEPTTGLDSSTALEVVRYLKLVATQGRTIVAIIHQPRYETFAMFDQVLMLAKGGRTVYEGRAPRALEYFTQLGFHLPSNTNPADFFMDVISGKCPRQGYPDFLPNDLVKIWSDVSSGQSSAPIPRSNTAESVNLAAGPVDKDIRVVPSFWSQLIHCTQRGISQKYRSPGTTKTYLLIHLAIAFALGSGFAQGSRMYLPPLPKWLAEFCPPAVKDLCMKETLFDTAVVQSSFFVNLSVGACAIVVSVLSFGDELPIFWREYRSGTNSLAYFIGKNIVDMFWVVYGSLFFTGVLVVMLRPTTSFADYYTLILSLEFTGYGMGYLMSVLFSKESAHVVGVVALFAFCVCSGISPQLKTVYSSFSVARIFWDLSFPRYIAEAAFVNMIKIYATDDSPYKHEIISNVDSRGYEFDSYARNIGITFVIGIAFRIAAYYFLIRSAKKKQ